MNFFYRTLPLALALAGLAPVALADKADRAQRVTIEADQPGSIDLLKQVVVFNGNVVISQGTLVIHADRVEMRESPEGFRDATALGSAARPATFRQKREGLDEFIEGSADRVHYDGRADSVTFSGHAQVRRLRGALVADEISGNEIRYDATAELFSVQGGPAAATPSNPGGRVRAVLTPREAPASAPAPAPRASQPGTALKPSGGLGERQ